MALRTVDADGEADFRHEVQAAMSPPSPPMRDVEEEDPQALEAQHLEVGALREIEEADPQALELQHLEAGPSGDRGDQEQPLLEEPAKPSSSRTHSTDGDSQRSRSSISSSILLPPPAPDPDGNGAFSGIIFD